MIKAFFFLAFLTTCLCSTYGQKKEVLECRYSITVFRDIDTIIVNKTVWITPDQIYEFNTNDSTKWSLYDFIKGERILNTPSGLRPIDIKSKRGKSSAKTIEGNYCNWKSNLTIQTIQEDLTETAFLDTTIKIPHSEITGYVDFLDNGLGYLTVRSERKRKGEIGQELMVFCLISKESKIVDLSIFKPI